MTMSDYSMMEFAVREIRPDGAGLLPMCAYQMRSLECAVSLLCRSSLVCLKVGSDN